jgi:hypothetical protein
MAEKDSQGKTPEPNPKQPQTQSQQGGKASQSGLSGELTTKAKQSSQKTILQGRAPTPEQEQQLNASAEYWRRVIVLLR